MGKAFDGYRCRKMATCLKEVEIAVLDLTKQLLGNGVSVEAIDIEYWPRYNKNRIGLKIWDGDNHSFAPNGIEICLTPDDVIAITKRRQILRRKF